ncbi:LuxR C-terminal-related transcriptional regulator [Actinomycetospora chlora]|uniref:LuxR C-terminal-related transcriptional regulator n=1 Tax=Actinomycetospora chlora TaxID=663608 RepID=UPI0031E7AAFD
MTSELAGRAPRPVSADYPVVIIDDHELFSTTLTMALRNEGFDARTLPVAESRSFATRPAIHPAGLVVLDLDLSRDADGQYVHGADLVGGLRAAGWKVLVVSGSSDTPGVAAAIAAGAIGSVPKSRSFGVLLGTVMDAAAGVRVMSDAEHQEWLERHRRYLAQERELSRRLARLSSREREVLELLAAGMRAATIAEHFVVSMPTVRTQIRSLLAKLEVGSQLEAVALLRQLPDPPERSRRGS